MPSHYEEFSETFKKLSDKELIETYLADINKPGWVAARADYYGAIHAEFSLRGIDYLAIKSAATKSHKQNKHKNHDKH